MTDLLKDTLAERAAAAEPPVLDLDGIISTGDRRLRRRRSVSIIGAAVVTLVVIAGGITATRTHEPPPPATTSPYVERRATYAIGDTIHYGKDVISVAPYKITAFVQTDAGFVFVSDTYGVFVADGREVRRISPDETTTRLVADDRGSLVGWVKSGNDTSESVVYDVAAGRELVRTPIGNKHGPGSVPFAPRIVGIDGDYAYFGTLDGLYRWDIPTSRSERIAKVSPVAVRTVASGQLVYQQPLEQAGTGLSLKVGPTLTSGHRTTYNGQQAFLSPEATYLVTQPDDAMMGIQPSWAGLQLFGVTADRGGPLPRPYWNFFFGQWLDDTNFTAAGVRSGTKASVLDLLTCNARTSACTVVAKEFSTFTFSNTPPRIAPFALPTGDPIIDLGE